MPIIVVGTEKNFAALRPRLFRGKVSTADTREVAEAVSGANPHADLDKLQPGTVLFVPDSPNVSLRGELSLDEPTTAMIEGLSEAGATALAELAAAAQTRESETAAERKQLARSLAGKQVTAAARKDKELAADLKATRDAIAEEEARATQRAAALEQAQGDWSNELAALKEILA
jgi:hypothetical protein